MMLISKFQDINHIVKKMIVRKTCDNSKIRRTENIDLATIKYFISLDFEASTTYDATQMTHFSYDYLLVLLRR